MRCDLCGSPMSPWFLVPGDWRKPTIGRSFTVFRCRQEGFARVDPIPSPRVLSEHYDIDDYYTHSSGCVERVSRPPVSFRAIGKLARHFDNGVLSITEEVRKRRRAGSSVLDVGAGAGQTLMQLQELGYSVVGIEPDSQADSLRNNFPIPVYEGTGENIPGIVSRQRFDMIVLSHVLEHTTDPIRVMRNAQSLLNPGGHVLVEVPNTSCLDFRLSKLNWQHLGVPRHLSFWNQSSLAAAAREVGFARTEFLYRHYARQLSWGWAQFGKDMIPFYRNKGAYRISIKQFTGAYYMGLFAITASLPAHLKYDSVVMVASR